MTPLQFVWVGLLILAGLITLCAIRIVWLMIEGA